MIPDNVDITGIIYLGCPYSSPLSHVRHDRWIKVSAAAGDLMHYFPLACVFSPISMGHTIATVGEINGGFERWRCLCLGVLRVCNVLVVLQLEGWQHSRGLKAEYEEAKSLGMPVYTMSLNGELVFTENLNFDVGN